MKSKLHARIVSVVIFFVFVSLLVFFFQEDEVPHLWSAGVLMFTIYIYRVFLKPEDKGDH
jgi:hypothetical protein